jgi:hypothetical protein
MKKNPAPAPAPAPLAYAIKKNKYTGPNPFTYSQAREYPRSKLNREFVPTSKYWSRFNVSNEILVGTRGSGKTILLRMLTYTGLLELSKGRYSEKVDELRRRDNVEYIAFYIPLRLRILNEIGLTDDPLEERKRFSFLFNCVSAGSIIDEVLCLILATTPDETERLLKERAIIEKLKEAWGLSFDRPVSSLNELKENIDRLFDRVRANWDLLREVGAFSFPLLEPIISILPALASALSLDSDRTTWIACFDEAEYLKPNLQRVLNTVMRSESRGLAVKIATLPFHYTEFETEVEGELIQPDGDDFRFESIDYSWRENDFIELTNTLVASRLEETALYNDLPETRVLTWFMGQNSDNDLVAIYKDVFATKDDNRINKKLIKALTRGQPDRKTNYSEGQLKRYRPIFFLREIYKKSRQGNRKIAWLAGPTQVRRVADGNVRRFIQICDNLFEKSRSSLLIPNAQHEAVAAFADRHMTRAKSVYEEGYLLDKLLVVLSSHLFEKMHNGPLMDVGVEFSVSADLLSHDKFRRALEMGVAYSYFHCPFPDLFYGITPKTALRLSSAVAAYKWLPMRAGSGMVLTAQSEIGAYLASESAIMPKGTAELAHNLELNFSND